MNRRIAAYLFFREHAGGIVGESGLWALRLAKAEEEAKERGIVFRWEYDDDADWSWMDDKQRAEEHEVEGCTALLDGGPVAGLCGIFDADANYRRVVEAELALEALSGLHAVESFERSCFAL